VSRPEPAKSLLPRCSACSQVVFAVQVGSKKSTLRAERCGPSLRFEAHARESRIQPATIAIAARSLGTAPICGAVAS